MNFENLKGASGIVLINKKAGISSNAVVNKVKHILGAKKCGHLGTLDLEGEGLLPVTVNNACRLFDFFLKKDKTYEAVFEFGYETDTLDLSGQVTNRKPCDVTLEQVENACKQMIGKSMQMPPQYSAKKVGGKVAYKEARMGKSVQLQLKEVEIFDLHVLKELGKNKFRFEIACSSGTYIRCICRDLAAKLSTYGVMHCILRTRCGKFYLKDAVTLEELQNGAGQFLSCEKVLDFDVVRFDEAQTQRLLNGQFLDCEKQSGECKVYCGDKFLGIGEVEQGKIKLKLRLF